MASSPCRRSSYFRLIEIVLESNKAMPASSMLFEMVKLEELPPRQQTRWSVHELVVVDQRVASPKFVSMPFPRPGPELLLFWIRLYWTLV